LLPARELEIEVRRRERRIEARDVLGRRHENDRFTGTEALLDEGREPAQEVRVAVVELDEVVRRDLVRFPTVGGVSKPRALLARRCRFTTVWNLTLPRARLRPASRDTGSLATGPPPRRAIGQRRPVSASAVS